MSWHDRQLTQHFRERAAHEAAYQNMRDRRREKEREEAKENRLDAVDNDVISAVQQAAELREIHERLDVLDAQVTESLMRNTEALERVRSEIQETLELAHVLPDGRRVFRTEDGTQVFDEFGQELSPDVIHPDEIDENHPFWEEFQALRAEEAELIEERERLLELQNDIDAVREAADAGELEPGALDALEAEFGTIENDSAPEAEAAQDPAQPTTPSATAAAPADSATKIQP